MDKKKKKKKTTIAPGTPPAESGANHPHNVSHRAMGLKWKETDWQRRVVVQIYGSLRALCVYSLVTWAKR